MLKRFDRAPQCGALAVLFILLPPPNLSAQPTPPQGQSGAQKKDSLVQATIQPPDSITIPDGMPLTLRLENYVSSATSKVGDTVSFSTAYPIRINGLVIVPEGRPVSGTIVQVSHARRALRDGQVKVAIEKLPLPNGELASLRPRRSGSRESKDKAKQLGRIRYEKPNPFFNEIVIGSGGLGLVVEAIMKGDETESPAGTLTTIYFNGPQNMNLGAGLMDLQPPSYKGPAQVFFKNHFKLSKGLHLFCGQKRVNEDYRLNLIRLELSPGIYSFSTGEAGDRAAQLEVHEDHQYWIERIREGLFVRDVQEHQEEIEQLERTPTALFDLSDLSLSVSSVENTSEHSAACLQVALP